MHRPLLHGTEVFGVLATTLLSRLVATTPCRAGLCTVHATWQKRKKDFVHPCQQIRGLALSGQVKRAGYEPVGKKGGTIRPEKESEGYEPGCVGSSVITPVQPGH